MKATLELINQMQADGVIGHYAIGGAVGAAYHAEPGATLDVEVFVTLPFDPDGVSTTLTRLHEYLVANGCKREGEHLEIRGWLVVFHPTGTNLEREAVAGSLPVEADGLRVWVIMAEHLIAIAMAANRLKDQPWILRLIEHEAVDDGMLQCILKTHGLTARWEEFDQIYGGRFVTKPEMRKRLAALSFSHKIEILEKLRDRSLAFAKARREHKQ